VQLWDRDSLECVQVLQGHTGSVLCLQYDENVIISGSSDATVRFELTLLFGTCGSVIASISTCTVCLSVFCLHYKNEKLLMLCTTSSQ